MADTFFKKILLWTIGISLALNPLFYLVPEKARAADNESYTDDESNITLDSDNTGLVSISNQADFAYDLTSTEANAANSLSDSSFYNDLITVYTEHIPSASANLTFDDIFTNTSDPKIVMTPKDKNAINILACMSEVTPDYANDHTALYNAVSSENRKKIDDAVSGEATSRTPRYTTREQYLAFLQNGTTGQNSAEHLNNVNFFHELVVEASGNFDENQLTSIWSEQSRKIRNNEGTGIDVETLACVTGLETSAVTAKLRDGKGSEISDIIDDKIQNMIMDIRVIKTLVYLVTPKDQGGAGHWRIKVARILQNAEKSHESDSTIQTNNETETPTLSTASDNTVSCDETMTAAECGSQINDNGSSVVVSDSDGTEYEAFFENMDSELDDARNTSAHLTGQAVDISQVDDIRCTLIKRKRIGKSIRTKQSLRPIKLAWQTTDGYTASEGDNPNDEMSLITSLARQSVVDLLSSMNSDITDYEGDLTRANFNDLIGILGQSMMSQVLTSTTSNFSGFDVTSTLKQLGIVYIADYFGLPREAFNNTSLNNLEDFKYIIGRSAIEKKLNIPYGSLESLNPTITDRSNPTVTRDVDGLVLNVGLRKLEKEMGLESYDLNRIFSDSKERDGSYLLDTTALGRIVIEDELNLPKRSWPTEMTSFAELGNYITDARVSLLRLEPGYIDSILHLDNGTTKSFIQGAMTSEDYAEKVGRNRYNNTVAGLKYFAKSNSAYNLPEGTWESALEGNTAAIKNVGIYILSQLLGNNAQDITLIYTTGDNTVSYLPANAQINKVIISSKDGSETNVTYDRNTFGRFVFREWLRSSLNGDRVNLTESCSKPRETNPTVSVTYSGQTVYNGPVDLSNPTSTDVSNTVSNNCRIYQSIIVNEIDYTVNGSDQVMKANGTGGTIMAEQSVSEANAISAGLEHLDLNTIMGYKTASTRSVFERIGAKMLYYAIANKALSGEDRVKINLMETNPSLNINDDGGTAAFYVSRALTVQNLVKKIKTEWEAVKTNDEQYKDITDRVNKIFDSIDSIYSEGDPGLMQISGIVTTITNIMGYITVIKENMEILKERYDYTDGGTETNNKIIQINALIVDLNELIRVSAEIMSGKHINSSDMITISQISTTSSSSHSSNESQTWKIMLKIFAFLSGRLSAEDLFVQLGASQAESQLSLPENSLFYLVQNFEKLGLKGATTLFQSIGQAKIEEELSLPMNYFQGNELVSVMPKFDKAQEYGSVCEMYSDLFAWANDKNGHNIILKEYMELTGDTSKPSGLTDNVAKFIVYTRQTNRDKFKVWVRTAQQRWHEKNKKYQVFEFNIDNVVRNIEQRGLTDGIRTAENDLLFRLGFPTGIFSGLKSGSAVSWQAANSRAAEIDSKLDLPSGYTKMLFTGSTGIDSKSLSNSDKNQLQASTMKISKNEIEKYIQMLNGELLTSEANEYSSDLTVDYIVNNPYADQTSSANHTLTTTVQALDGTSMTVTTGSITGCAVQYSEQNGFYVNETALNANSFCYYDKKGRHCFQSRVEAEHYWTEHQDDRITNILDDIAVKIASAYNTGSEALIGDLKTSLAKFVNDKKTATIFNDETLMSIANQESINIDALDDSGRLEIARAFFKTLATKTNVDAEILINLFTREMVNSPLAAYKSKVGMIVARNIITTKLFDSLGITLDSNLFDAGDLYAVLTGDFSSLGRIGATLIDNALGLPSGTSALIYTAVSTNSIACALTQAGGSIVGRALGLDYFPVDKILTDGSNLFSYLAEEKIEETLKLARGTFRVDSNDENNNLANLIDNVRIINFIDAYKIPIDVTDKATRESFNQYVKTILGKEKYASIENTAPEFKLQKVRDFLNSSLVISATADDAVTKLENFLKAMLESADSIFAKMAINSTLTKVVPSDADNETQNVYANYNYRTEEFQKHLNYMDSVFGSSSKDLLTGQITPKSYLYRVGDSLALRFGAVKLGTLLGLSDDESSEAYTLATNITKIFKCESRNSNGSCADSNFQNWQYLYESLSKIFDFSLDHTAGLPEGTISRMLANPNNTFSILLEIGAEKLDSQLDIDSKSEASFSGLYRLLDATVLGGFENQCNARAFPDVSRSNLNAQITQARQGLSEATKNGDGENIVYNQHQIEELTAQLNTNQSAYNACVRELRNNYIANEQGMYDPETTPDAMDMTIAYLEFIAADYLHNKIANVVVHKPNCTYNCQINVGIDMPIADIIKLFNGDLRYLTVASAAIGANLVMVAIDSITINNCNPAEKGTDGCRAPVPEAMRISYDEIKLAIFGLPESEVQAIANFNDATNGEYQNDPDNFVVGQDGCSENTVYNGIRCIAQDGTVKNSENNVINETASQYGYNPTNVANAIGGLDAKIKTIEQNAQASCAGKTGEEYANCYQGYLNNSPEYSQYQDRLYRLQNPDAYADSYQIQEVQNTAKKIAMQNLKYDLMDIALWKLDDNIFPGFSKAIMSGNTGEKWSAMAQYIKNGLSNGHLFGIKFNAIDINLVEAVASFIAYFVAPDSEKQNALNNINEAQYNTVVNFISKNSKNWFGFEINPEMTGAILTSLTTGNWGLDSFSLDGVFGDTGKTTAFAGKERLTFGGAVVNFGLSKVFSWTDKALGLKDGQSLQIFTATKNIYKAYKLSREANAAYELAKGTAGEAKAKLAADKAKEQVTAAISAAVQFVITIIVDKLLGKTISQWEYDLELVPGSLLPVISGIIYEGVAAATNAIGGSTLLASMGPYGWLGIAAVFLLTNLFGIYKVEYWCSADGVYPELGVADASKYDVSDLGYWGGRVGSGDLNQKLKAGMIAAAQYKARRLIGDLMEIQYNSTFNDNNDEPVTPIQIMTGRTEDVEYWKDVVATNVCKKRLGDDAELIYSEGVAVCNAGENRMGLWQNSQTVAWTHIGF